MKELRERLNQLLDRLGVAWEGLSERERIMVGSLGGALVVFVLFLAWFLTASAISGRREKLDGMYAALADIESAAADYGARESERKSHELRLDREVPSLKGRLEEAATAAGTPIDSFGSEKRTPAKGKKYDEVSVEVKFRRVELPKITDFMKRLEGDREYAFVIKRLNMRVDFSDKTLLNVEMEVATYIRVAPLDKPPEPRPGEADAVGLESGDEGEDGDGAATAGPRKPGPRPLPGVRSPGVPGAGLTGPGADFGAAGPAAGRPGPVRPVSGMPAGPAAGARTALPRPALDRPAVKLPPPPVRPEGEE